MKGKKYFLSTKRLSPFSFSFFLSFLHCMGFKSPDPFFQTIGAQHFFPSSLSTPPLFLSVSPVCLSVCPSASVSFFLHRWGLISEVAWAPELCYFVSFCSRLWIWIEPECNFGLRELSVAFQFRKTTNPEKKNQGRLSWNGERERDKIRTRRRCPDWTYIEREKKGFSVDWMFWGPVAVILVQKMIIQPIPNHSNWSAFACIVGVELSKCFCLVRYTYF